MQGKVARTLQQMELCANIEIQRSMKPLIWNNALQRTRGTIQDKDMSPSLTLFSHLPGISPLRTARRSSFFKKSQPKHQPPPSAKSDLPAHPVVDASREWPLVAEREFLSVCSQHLATNNRSFHRHQRRGGRPRGIPCPGEGAFQFRVAIDGRRCLRGRVVLVIDHSG